MAKLKIMIVEDSPTTAEILRDLLLMSWACDPVIFCNGKDAWEHLIQNKDISGGLPDLIVLDLDLPGKPGMEILNGIKTTPGMEQILVIVNSGTAQLEHVLAVKKWENDRVIFLKKGMGQPSVSDMMMRLKRQGLLAD